jgi:hypothetical protein
VPENGAKIDQRHAHLPCFIESNQDAPAPLQRVLALRPTFPLVFAPILRFFGWQGTRTDSTFIIDTEQPEPIRFGIENLDHTLSIRFRNLPPQSEHDDAAVRWQSRAKG